MKYLQNHEKVHDYQIFKCKFCTKQLSTKSNLNIHIKLCHRSCTYFEVCEVCKAKFKRKSDLTRHEKKHADKYFLCEYCDKKFSFKCNLVRHIKTIHKN